MHRFIINTRKEICLELGQIVNIDGVSVAFTVQQLFPHYSRMGEISFIEHKIYLVKNTKQTKNKEWF